MRSNHRPPRGRGPLQVPVRRILSLALIAATAVVLGPVVPARAEDPRAVDRARDRELAKPEHRRILALVDSLDEGWELSTQDAVHRVAEMPLAYLGMVVERHDIRAGPPPESALHGCRAVLTFFQHAEDQPAWLWPWLENQARPAGVRFVHLGDFGPLSAGGRDDARLAAWLEEFGLGYDGGWVPGPLGIEIEYADPALCTVEGSARTAALHHGPWVAGTANRPWITTRATLDEGDRDRHAVVTGPWGGVALMPWIGRLGTGEGDRRIYLDLFRFFEEALDLRGVPAPHPAVLNGRRMFFVQVDGDGFESRSTIQAGQFCAQVFLDRVIDRYELPLTVSIIVRSLTPDYAISEPTPEMRLARQVFSRPNVEIASHGVLHPFWWGRPLSDAKPDQPIAAYQGLENYEYGAIAEVRDSINFINERLAPPDKPCGVMLWTGMAVPPLASIHAAAGLGCTNLNGGPFRWDSLYDSIGYVSPYARVERESGGGLVVQPYVGAPNENDFAGFFDTMPAAFRHVDTTIERTGSPRVLKPANVYIHFYTAARPARLRSLTGLLQRWAVDEPTAPVFASTYARAVQSALSTATVLRTADGWDLRDFGDCHTVRIDHDERDVDFTRSSGVLGARRVGATLWVHLARPNAHVVLAHEPQAHPRVVEASHVLSDAELAPDGLRLRSTSLAPRLIAMDGFPADSAVAVHVGAALTDRTTDAAGRLRIELPPGDDLVEVRIR